MSFEQSSEPTVMASPPAPPSDFPEFTPNLEGNPPKKKKTWLIILIIVLLLCCCCLVIGGGAYWGITNGLIDTNFEFDIDDFSYLSPVIAALV